MASPSVRSGAVSISFNSKRFIKKIKNIDQKKGQMAVQLAMKRTGFDLRDAEGDEALRAFEVKNRNFWKKGFFFYPVRKQQPQVRLRPKPKSMPFVWQHARGVRIVPESRGGIPRLEDQGPPGSTNVEDLATPNPKEPVVKRGKSGKVRKAKSPGRVLGTKGRGFVVGNLVLERYGRRKPKKAGGRKRRKRKSIGPKDDKVRKLYFLHPKAKLKKTFMFFPVFGRTAKKRFPKQMKRAWREVRLSG